MACPGKLQEFILVLAQDGFLNKHQMIRLQQVNQLLGHRLMDPSVEIHSDSHAWYRFLNRCHPFHCRVQFVIGVDPPQLVCSVHLDGLVSLCRRFLCRLSGVPRMISADPAVNLYAVPAFPPEQIINRYAQGFSLDIPHCLLNAGNGACQNGAAPVKPGPVHLLESVLDIRRAVSDQLRAQFLHGGCHTVRLSFADRFTPADQAVVRCHFQEQPSRGNLEKLQLCNFHVHSSSVTVCLIYMIPYRSKASLALIPLRTASPVVFSPVALAHARSMTSLSMRAADHPDRYVRHGVRPVPGSP